MNDVSTASWQARYEGALMRTFTTPPRLLARGEGCWVWDNEGVPYLDFVAGIAVNALGHAHPALVNAVTHQVSTLAHVSNLFATEPQLQLAERLQVLTGAGPLGRVFFANSGTEAIEAAFKLARLNRGENGQRTRILALHHAFHGRSMGALALTAKPALRTDFLPLPDGVEHIDASIAALETAMDEHVAALVIEPIQGEAGVIPLPEGYLRRARELTERFGALLVVDEIQTGIGRTGRWFGYQHEGILPDAIALAKGLGGGVPIGALVTFGSASEIFAPGQHGSTFGGNPLATAAALAVLSEIDRAGLVDNAASRGVELTAIINGFDSPLISGVRGAGLLLGIALREPVAARLTEAALANGLIVNAANESTIRLAPPLIVGDAELAAFRDRFARALAATTP